MRVFVTGSAGFVGRHMMAELQRRGHQTVGCDIVEGWDALDTFRVNEQRADLVVHCAARSPHRLAIDGDPGMHPYNAMLDAAMFEWAIRTRQRHVLYFSSCAAADGPVDGYAATKLAGERLAAEARRAGVTVTVVRPYSGYGADQSEDFPFRAMLERARRRDDPFQIWGDGSQVRDWVHIDDVIGQSLRAVAEGMDGPVPVATGVGTSMLELAQLMCKTAGYEPEFEFRLDRPAGAGRRVGAPYYAPRVSLADAVERALR